MKFSVEMIRKCVLIGGHDEDGDKPTKGTEKDLIKWQAFLKSPIGGSWNQSEIQEVTTGSATDVAAALSWAHNAHYSLICFSGHGRLDKDEEGNFVTKMMLHDNAFISEDDLNTGTKWCMAIMDCCRGYDEPEVLTEEASMESFSIKCRQNARVLFERALQKCESGFARVYATQEKQFAGDKRSFTRKLIETSKAHIDDFTNGILNIKDAVKLVGTFAYDDKLKKQQTPVYEGERRLHHFPFAVRATPLCS